MPSGPDRDGPPRGRNSSRQDMRRSPGDRLQQVNNLPRGGMPHTLSRGAKGRFHPASPPVLARIPPRGGLQQTAGRALPASAHATSTSGRPGRSPGPCWLTGGQRVLRRATQGDPGQLRSDPGRSLVVRSTSPRNAANTSASPVGVQWAFRPLGFGRTQTEVRPRVRDCGPTAAFGSPKAARYAVTPSTARYAGCHRSTKAASSRPPVGSARTGCPGARSDGRPRLSRALG